MASLTVHFMYDNHTFARLLKSVPDRNELIAWARSLFNEDNCGMLFVRDSLGGTLESLELHGRRMANGHYGVTLSELERWADAVLAEESFLRLVA